MRRKPVILILLFSAIFLTGCGRKGPAGLHVLVTGDVHGAYFQESYVDDGYKNSLCGVKWYADSIRTRFGKNNVLLIDAGDVLQGDNASFYYNYVSASSRHVYPAMAKCAGYDAVVVGNHDLETGHDVYDKVRRQLAVRGIPFLAGNALKDNGKPYFREYAIYRKAGRKILLLGYTNANIKSWIVPASYSGMDFESLVPFVQKRVDVLRERFKPDAVIVATHSGTGLGNSEMLESQGLDLFNTLHGVDVLICAHDHNPLVLQRDSMLFLNSGSKAGYLAHGTVSFEDDGAVRYSAELIKMDKTRRSGTMSEKFRKEFTAVRDFTMREVGFITDELRTRDALAGQSFYTNLLHKVQLDASGADISFAAPLTFNKTIPAGKLVFNDMFTIYPYENTLCTVSLYGREIKDYLELSYSRWVKNPKIDGHVFVMSLKDDNRYFRSGWSFDYRPYNFDSAAGIDYCVDITAGYGDRISISSLADGRCFSPDSLYCVAMTSYRASGEMLSKGTGLSKEELELRKGENFPEIRDLIYDYIVREGGLDPNDFGSIGTWSFVPSGLAPEIIGQDMNLMFI